MRAYGGRVFHLDAHLERLEESCRGLARRLPAGRHELSAWTRAVLAESGEADAVIRLSVHWECSGLYVWMLRPFVGHPAAWYETGVAVRTGTPRRPSPRAQEAQVKASQFVAGVLAHLDKSGPEPHEILFLNDAGTLAEGTVSNVFVVKKKRLLTPPAASGILRGVTRGTVIEIAREEGFPLVEIPLTRHDVYSADECFMTNTSSEILPVVSADARRIGDGRPGPVTSALARAFKRKVSESV